MKILQINQNYQFGSTGRIMKEINDTIIANGHEGYMLCAFSYQEAPNLYVMSKLPVWLAVRITFFIHRLTGLTGYRSMSTTKRAINFIDKCNPDIVHLHNIHGDWINLKLLFKYLKYKNIPIVWTLHDCWSFTGRCSHFENTGCYKWKEECHNCPNRYVFPRTYFFDFSRKMYHDKKKWFLGLNKVEIVTPSQWLGNYVKNSFLGTYNIKTINNGIDLGQFRIYNTRSKYLKNVWNKRIILGVSSTWTPEKGLPDLLKLNEIIDRDRYQIVIVGLNNTQLRKLPNTIIGIGRTRNVSEMAELYSNADVFVNPTYQDNYPTVNLEAIACGTPVVTYNTGGSVESVTEEVGMVTEKGNIIELKNAIEEICDKSLFSKQICRDYALKHFAKEDRYNDYMVIYKNIIEE